MRARVETARAAGYTVRELEQRDLSNGLLETLSNLSEVGDLNLEEAEDILRRVRTNPFHKIFVAVLPSGEVVGATTLLIESKFIHRGGKVGHIEDVSVRKEWQGRGIGRIVVRKAVEYAKMSGCYKCILDCKESVVPFYERLGYRRFEVGMRIDLARLE